MAAVAGVSAGETIIHDPRPLIAVPAMRSPKVAGLRRSGVVVAERIAESIYRAGESR